MRSALIIFAKVPVPGEVKTRLTPDIKAREAADLYGAFLRDLLARFARLGVDTRLYLAPAAAAPPLDPAPRTKDLPDDLGPRTKDLPLDPALRTTDLPDNLVPDGVTVHAQRGRDLGERLARAFFEAFGAGYDRVVITGSDHPTLPNEFVEHAFDSLAHPKSVVLGPADDGGYYLIGMNDYFPELFRQMVYSRADVLRQTLARLPSAEIHVTILPPWYDIDTIGDLCRLAAELDTEPEVHSCTRQVMARLSERYPWIRQGVDEG